MADIQACCLSGQVHTGKPKGRTDLIGGVQCYIAEPRDGSPARSVVFITDLFGWEFVNVRLLADLYAQAGFYVYIPDLHEGDSVPVSFLQTAEPNLQTREKLSLADKAKNAALVPATLGAWLPNHRESVTRPILDGFINSVRQIPRTNKIGAVGFCWGGRYAILQAHGRQMDAQGTSVGGVDAAVAYHPSLLSIPSDFEGVRVPLALAVGDKDSLLPMESIGQIQDVLGAKTDLPKEIRIYENQIHGFALRSDWSSDADKTAMDESTQQGIRWLQQYL